MKVLVLLKEVPVVSAIQIDPETKRIDRSGAGQMMNPPDANAIEAALTIAGSDGSVTAISMGPESCEDVLRQAVGMGAKQAIRVTDSSFAGADTLVTASVLKAAADKSGPYDCIVCGAQSIDGQTGQIAAKLGTLMGMGILTNASAIEKDDQGLTIERKAGAGYEKLSAPFPVVVSVAEGANKPRNVSLKGRTAMKKAQIEVYDSKTLELEGILLQSKSVVTGLAAPDSAQKGLMITGADDQDSAQKLVDVLLENHYV